MPAIRKTAYKPSKPRKSAHERKTSSRRETVRWRRRAEARPQEILEAALAVFAERGFAAARMETIAARAGVSKGTLYLYFDSKEEIFKALLQTMLVSRIDEIAAQVRGQEGLVAPLIANV